MMGDNHISFLLQGLQHSSRGKHGLPIPFERHPLDAWASPTLSKQPIGTMGSMCQALWGIYISTIMWASRNFKTIWPNHSPTNMSFRPFAMEHFPTSSWALDHVQWSTFQRHRHGHGLQFVSKAIPTPRHQDHDHHDSHHQHISI